jgi:ABC-type nickel/cobalt efflux system permease component RcnA
VVWGIGHTVTLLLVTGSAMLLKLTIGTALAAALELVVGVMVVTLGGLVLWRWWTDRIHVHAHSHGGKGLHVHAHSHRGEDALPHGRSDHRHEHAHGLPWRTFLVGLVHGMAGSAALVVLTATTLDRPLSGLVYILCFGLGSIIGMAAFSLALAIPLTYTARSLTSANRALQPVIGLSAVTVGLFTLKESGLLLLA